MPETGKSGAVRKRGGGGGSSGGGGGGGAYRDRRLVVRYHECQLSSFFIS